jgi:hypothetical protein
VCGWQVDRDGLYLFSLVITTTIADIATNDSIKLYCGIAIGDPDTDGILLAGSDSICTDIYPKASFAIHAWRPLRAGNLVQTYAGQVSSRNRDITIVGGTHDYFSYNRMGRYPM